MSDPVIRAHQEWLGLIQPVGLVVSPAALANAQVVLDGTSNRERWLAFDALLEDDDRGKRLASTERIFTSFLEWPRDLLLGSLGDTPVPEGLTVHLPALNDRLEPTFAVLDVHHDGDLLLLGRIEPDGTPLDRPVATHDGWNASPHNRFERLLRETKVPIGVLANEREVRLVYAPAGESSGYLSFPVASMAMTDGRPMLFALYELLKGWRLDRTCPRNRSLRALLEESRKYQNVVSTKLATQVLGALYELSRGFQAADDAAHGSIVQETLSNAASDVYGGLLTTIMRTVFVLYAEERGMMPQDAAWVESYGVGALFERLRQDRVQYPDTMDLRFGAWPRLLSLWRILHDGARHEHIAIPARAGDLFDPDVYPFLEGRPWRTRRVMGEPLANVPRVSDGSILRVLERLLILDEERISYRALDVEQIGSVYEAMMGFEVRRALGPSISVRPKSKKAGSPSHSVVNLQDLLSVPGRDRAKWLRENGDCELPERDTAALSAATSIEEMTSALESRRSEYTPYAIPLGGIVLVPTEERRRSGSHYTPRELTEPIVANALRPILERLGDRPTVDQLLELRICDPAMGSGAFLVGACRFLGDKIAEAWQRDGNAPEIPPDEDPQLYARRLVAQRCLFGVDRNPFAVQLAKLSLWLVTLARDHPFTFLDHALRPGDSLVGLTRKQLRAFHWAPAPGQMSFLEAEIDDRVKRAVDDRARIESMATSDDTYEKRRLLEDADNELRLIRLTGDAIIWAFFGYDKAKKRREARDAFEQLVSLMFADGSTERQVEEIGESMRAGEPPVLPFHWEIEFPEVFARENPGFDAIVGNPPFAGKNTLIKANPVRYLDWLQEIHDEAHGNSDLVAHFFRRAFTLLRQDGSFGLIATNTIAQGDTRFTGLRWLRRHGLTIYDARRRYKWPGAAAVVVSVVHGVRGQYAGVKLLDGNSVERITAFLFHAGGEEDPKPLRENGNRSFIGSQIHGAGFTFDDEKEEATPIAEMQRLIATNPRNAQVIFPYIGGEEVNNSPTHDYHRYVINFGQMSESAAQGWPDLMSIVEQRVKPEREKKSARVQSMAWWLHLWPRPELYAAISDLDRVLVTNCGATPYMSFAFLPSRMVYAHSLAVFALTQDEAFCVLQSRLHEVWARFFASSMKDDLRYTPSDCFETFPFPDHWATSETLKCAGSEYLEFRAHVMVRNNEGLTTTYNRFHDPNEQQPQIHRLRDLHAAMDRAVLDAYGWRDIRPTCEFILDYEDEEDDVPSTRRKPYRHRWPNEIRDEVLARLLELNHERATQGR